MITMDEMLKLAVEKGASDIFLVVGQPISFKISGVIEKQEEQILLPDVLSVMIDRFYVLAGRDNRNREFGDDDFSISVPRVGRFRVNVFKQRGTWGAVLRVVNFDLPDVQTMGIPQTILDMGRKQKGLVLVTGAAGSGKSTTLAYIIDTINKNRNCHILTLEDPIEFLHSHRKSIVSQREVGIDSSNYSRALKASLREAPDVILIGEMRDLETIEIAMTAAETGHLVLSTLHTIGAANTIDRIVDVFPPEQQQQIRFQLSMVLESVISQQLIPTLDGKLAPAFEILKVNSAIRTLIRDGKIHQIPSTIATSREDGMVAMDDSILKLYRDGRIDENSALYHCINQENMKRNLRK